VSTPHVHTLRTDRGKVQEGVCPAPPGGGHAQGVLHWTVEINCADSEQNIKLSRLRPQLKPRLLYPVLAASPEANGTPYLIHATPTLYQLVALSQSRAILCINYFICVVSFKDERADPDTEQGPISTGWLFAHTVHPATVT
jgi:hypothetical protein